MLVGFRPAHQEQLGAQDLCYECTSNVDYWQHKMSFLAPPIAWYEEPNSYHSWWLSGLCVYMHYAGCSMFDEEEIAALKELEGEDLLDMLEEHPVNLRVLPEYEVLQVVDCSGDVAAWIPLRESQLQALAGQ